MHGICGNGGNLPPGPYPVPPGIPKLMSKLTSHQRPGCCLFAQKSTLPQQCHEDLIKLHSGACSGHGPIQAALSMLHSAAKDTCTLGSLPAIVYNQASKGKA